MGKINWSAEKLKSSMRVIGVILTIILCLVSLGTDSEIWIDMAIIMVGLYLFICGILDLKVNKKVSIFLIISGSICVLANLIRLIV